MPTSKTKPAAEAKLGTIKDRIKELRRMTSAELKANDRNWRLHPYAQRKAIVESLETVGIADVLVAYESERNGGALTLIDGHARLEETADQVEWPVVVLDVTDEEADLLLLTLDPMTGMAELDPQALRELLDGASAGTPGLEDLLRQLRGQVGAPSSENGSEEQTEADPLIVLGPPEMELQAFEHYDYVILLYRNALDWQRAKELFDLQQEGFTLRDGVTRKIGLGRVVDGRRLFDLVDGKGG
jgi:hypothetical protein